MDFLRSKRLLLVLDNCEHVIDAVAVLVDTLARRCRDVTVLATSREPLGVEAERVVPVPPLPVPAARRGRPACTAPGAIGGAVLVAGGAPWRRGSP